MKRIVGFLAVLLVLAFPLVALAEEAATPQPGPSITAPEGPLWAQIVYTVVSALAVFFLVPYLRRKAAAAKAEALTQDLSARGMLSAQVKEFLLERAASIAEKQFPKLAQLVLQKELSAERIKEYLRSWGKDLKNEAIAYFSVQGVDVLAAFGDKGLDLLIEWAANATSPFPGKTTAVELAKKEWSNKLIKFGVDWVRENWLDQKTEEATFPPTE